MLTTRDHTAKGGHDLPADQIGQPLDSLLASYALGQLTPHLNVLVASHLCLSPQSRRFVAGLESLHGEAMMSTAVETSPARRDQRLEAIFSSAPSSISSKPKTGRPSCSILPPPIVALTGKDFSALSFKTLLPGIKEYKLDAGEDGEASLLWIKPGRTMPSHTHEGSEYTLVLKGGFKDASGHYRRGDLAIADSDIDHHPKADDDEDCICFAYTEHPVRLTGFFGSIAQRLMGR
jgi:putative transcriptional regulator